MPYLKGKVCLVTGASRGIGRGIALQLAENGAICYITGRSLEKLQLVCNEAISRNSCGEIIPVECNHSDDDQVEKVFERISNERSGKLDLLVNNAYSAVQWIVDNAPDNFWDQSMDGWDQINNVGLRNHYRCAIHASRIMVKNRKGLIINISSIGGKLYFQTPAYGVGKSGKDRMAHDCGLELKKYNITYISLWPGPVRTEAIQEARKSKLVNESISWMFNHGESTEYSGKCIAALLCESDIIKRSGQIVMSSDVGAEYDIKDIDGRYPVNMRSLKTLCAGAKAVWLADYVPACLKLPHWIYNIVLSYAQNTGPKNPTKYA